MTRKRPGFEEERVQDLLLNRPYLQGLKNFIYSHSKECSQEAGLALQAIQRKRGRECDTNCVYKWFIFASDPIYDGTYFQGEDNVEDTLIKIAEKYGYKK